MPTEITHNNIQPSIDLTMGVQGRDLGHVADDISALLADFGEPLPDGDWAPYDPTSSGSKRTTLTGSKIVLDHRPVAVSLATARAARAKSA